MYGQNEREPLRLKRNRRTGRPIYDRRRRLIRASIRTVQKTANPQATAASQTAKAIARTARDLNQAMIRMNVPLIIMGHELL